MRERTSLDCGSSLIETITTRSLNFKRVPCLFPLSPNYLGGLGWL